ncbi:hypothetical protein [Allomesorhizobium alhagi]|uniref:hypothetical protein n=1 Tax=Allomesorhizobium alhagi TaxID=475067 RepID=UPI0011122D0D|nr:hypothetical protein [Mesorhizobium alhagi]
MTRIHPKAAISKQGQRARSNVKPSWNDRHCSLWLSRYSDVLGRMVTETHLKIDNSHPGKLLKLENEVV